MDKDGKKVALDPSESRRPWSTSRSSKASLHRGCIGWLEPANNKVFLTSQIRAPTTPSIMVSAKRDLPEMGVTSTA
jgi:hypothetical protein